MVNKIAAGTMAIVLDRSKHQVLLHLRSDNGMWGLPGGSCEFGETFESTVKREIFEETGIYADILSVFGAFSDPREFIFSYPDGNNVQGFMLGFECLEIGGEINANNAESLDVKWFPWDALPENIYKNHKSVLAAYRNRAGFVLN